MRAAKKFMYYSLGLKDSVYNKRKGWEKMKGWCWRLLGGIQEVKEVCGAERGEGLQYEKCEQEEQMKMGVGW